MTQDRRVTTARRLPRAFVLLAAVPLLALAGCGDQGELRGAGETPTAVGPSRLWPTLAPATTPALDYGEADTEIVKGIEIANDDIHQVDPVAVLRAQVAAHPDEYTGRTAMYPETAERLGDCGNASSARGKDCPVLQPYYRDLTGDGKDDLILGFTLLGDQLTVRVYTFEKHQLVQVMNTTDAVIGVEFAGRDLIVRAASTLPGYEYRTVWSWDTHQHAMLATRDEILRIGDSTPTSAPTTTSAPTSTSASTSTPTSDSTPTSESTPTSTPSASPSAS
ncbi:hypothetical protein ACFYPC_02920 [Streptomyces sp. NPDC005808]|uniref:hypothetical protein n=1 Tax=Streptomyces sp. NPDC005808 TaxID=3364734 RepID=UPI0036B521D7